jgi:hypothetical protein
VGIDTVDDSLLLVRSRNDPDAFASFYRRHVDGVHRVFHRYAVLASTARELPRMTVTFRDGGTVQFPPH